MKTTEQGAASSVFLATSRRVACIGGRYFEDCHEAELVDELRGGIFGVLPHAFDLMPRGGCGTYPISCSPRRAADGQPSTTKARSVEVLCRRVVGVGRSNGG
ncbi:hypothetical protein [Tenggerimyces flavus]|uniref:Uncharacterized protein n=1 Tax=Tenggerimyces flavus TaxID=1708749 RepID=A0ABV7Y4H9_9ACTN|nr:hypothetical protein [Tenggerimyces flavus]MBM7790094.1 hypothetical protein [Tenggerimyces flavus]